MSYVLSTAKLDKFGLENGQFRMKANCGIGNGKFSEIGMDFTATGLVQAQIIKAVQVNNVALFPFEKKKENAKKENWVNLFLIANLDGTERFYSLMVRSYSEGNWRSYERLLGTLNLHFTDVLTYMEMQNVEGKEYFNITFSCWLNGDDEPIPYLKKGVPNKKARLIELKSIECVHDGFDTVYERNEAFYNEVGKMAYDSQVMKEAVKWNHPEVNGSNEHPLLNDATYLKLAIDLNFFDKDTALLIEGKGGGNNAVALLEAPKNA